jgi:twitching motility protein PilT
MQTTDNITLNRLLTNVAKEEASDLHLTVGAPPVVRKEGALYQMENEEVVTVNFLDRIIESFLTETDRAQLEREREMVLTHTFNKVLRFRIHLYKQKGHFSLIFRYIPLMTKNVSGLGLPAYLERIVCDMQGLIVVTGTLDSGKSTTLAAIINTINESGPPRYITTLEKPIEHIYANNKCIIEQREVGRDIASYEQGLNLVLEEDIDTVVLDRLQSGSVMKKALEVLAAGRTVVVTVEASFVIHALAQLFNFIDANDLAWGRQIIAHHLRCMLLQKLVHKIGGGRMLAYEFVVNAGMVQSVIASGHFDRLDTVVKGMHENDMITLEESLANLVQKGEVKLEEALMEARDRNYLKSLLR